MTELERIAQLEAQVKEHERRLNAIDSLFIQGKFVDSTLHSLLANRVTILESSQGISAVKYEPALGFIKWLGVLAGLILTWLLGHFIGK